jgi:nucleoside-diphosphate-sugar epimerase
LLGGGFAIPSGTDVVFYLAQSPRYRDGHRGAEHVLNVNVVSAVQVASLAIQARVRKFVYASTGNVYAPAFTPRAETAALQRSDLYAMSKIHAEEALNLYSGHIDVTIARLFGLYGSGQQGRLIPNLVAAIASGKPVVIERNPSDPADLGGLRISLCHVEDASRILAALSQREQVPVINVANGEMLSLRDIATTIGHCTGRDPSFEIAVGFRKGDLVADITALTRLLNPDFTPFGVGLPGMLGARLRS